MGGFLSVEGGGTVEVRLLDGGGSPGLRDYGVLNPNLSTIIGDGVHGSKSP